MRQSRARRAILACAAAAALVFSAFSVAPASAISGDTLEACINDAVNATDPATPANELTTLDCSEYTAVTSLAGIQTLTSLTSLTIVGATGADGSLAPLSGLDTLQNISITRFNVSDASALGTFDGLATLDLSNNHLTSLNGLHACVALTATGQTTSLGAVTVGASSTLPAIVAPDGSPVTLLAAEGHTPVPTLSETSVTWDGPGTGTLTWSDDITGECTMHFSGTLSQEVDAAPAPPPAAPPAPPAPSISFVDPAGGTTAGGDTITISGTGFIGTTAVSIGGVRLSFFRVDSNKQITAITRPFQAGTYSVVVTGPGGTSRQTRSGAFSFVDPPPRPTITSITPAVGESAGGDTVVIHGTNLYDANITFGGTAARAVGSSSSTQVTVRTPQHAIGAVTVVATSDGGSSQEPVTFSFLSKDRPRPASLRVSPNHGTQLGGTKVTITGQNIVNPTGVTVNGVKADFEFRQPAASSREQGSVTFTTPSSVKTGMVTVAVTTIVGTGTVDFNYDKTAGPSKLKLSILHGSQLGGDQIKVTGTNLANPTSITLGGIVVPFTVQAPAAGTDASTGYRILLTTPGSPKSGPVAIVVKTVAGSATVNFTYDKADAPSQVRVSPDHGSQLGGSGVEIEGKNIANATSVTVGGVSLPFSETKPTAARPSSTITLTMPGSAKAISVPIVVSTTVGSGRVLYVYQKASAPTNIKVTPAHGSQLGGDTVTITGSNLDNASAVTIGGIQVPFVETVNPTSKTGTNFRIVITSPGVGTAGDNLVQVTTLAGSGTGKFVFDKAGIPADVRAQPNSASQVGGSTVTVSGQNLQNIQSVTVGGVPVTFSVVSATTHAVSTPSIQFTTPGSSTAGAADIIVANVLGSTRVNFGYTKEGPPASLKLNPATGSQLGGTKVTLTGSNIENITSITVGGVPVIVTRPDDRTAATPGKKVTFVLPGSPLAGSTPVVVTTPVGSATVTFTYS